MIENIIAYFHPRCLSLVVSLRLGMCDMFLQLPEFVVQPIQAAASAVLTKARPWGWRRCVPRVFTCLETGGPRHGDSGKLQLPFSEPTRAL